MAKVTTGAPSATVPTPDPEVAETQPAAEKAQAEADEELLETTDPEVIETVTEEVKPDEPSPDVVAENAELETPPEPGSSAHAALLRAAQN